MQMFDLQIIITLIKIRRPAAADTVVFVVVIVVAACDLWRRQQRWWCDRKGISIRFGLIVDVGMERNNIRR